MAFLETKNVQTLSCSDSTTNFEFPFIIFCRKLTFTTFRICNQLDVKFRPKDNKKLFNVRFSTSIPKVPEIIVGYWLFIVHFTELTDQVTFSFKELAFEHVPPTRRRDKKGLVPGLQPRQLDKRSTQIKMTSSYSISILILIFFISNFISCLPNDSTK